MLRLFYRTRTASSNHLSEPKGGSVVLGWEPAYDVRGSLRGVANDASRDI